MISVFKYGYHYFQIQITEKYSKVLCQVNTALFPYQSREGAGRVFTSLGDPTAVLSTFAGNAPYHIIFSEPDDQDFDLARCS